MLRKKQILAIAFAITIGLTLTVHQLQFNVYGSEISPYESGRDHGCDDAGISDPSERYINQPGKGPSFHTKAFMQGYDRGFNECLNSFYVPPGSEPSSPNKGILPDTPPPSNRYYEGFDWNGVCNNAIVRQQGITQPCNILVTPDGNALTSEGKSEMEKVLCPKGPGIIGTIELFYKDIPTRLENELAGACGWE
jgi:hypothetical protein